MGIRNQELIKILNKCNPDAIVCVSNNHLAENGSMTSGISLCLENVDIEDEFCLNIKWMYKEKYSNNDLRKCTAILLDGY